MSPEERAVAVATEAISQWGWGMSSGTLKSTYGHEEGSIPGAYAEVAVKALGIKQVAKYDPDAGLVKSIHAPDEEHDPRFTMTAVFRLRALEPRDSEYASRREPREEHA